MPSETGNILFLHRTLVYADQLYSSSFPLSVPFISLLVLKEMIAGAFSSPFTDTEVLRQPYQTEVQFSFPSSLSATFQFIYLKEQEERKGSSVF